MPWGPQKHQLYETSTDAVSVLDQIEAVLEELEAENPSVTSEPPIQVSGTIRHIQSKSRFAKFSQPIAFVIEIAKGLGGKGAVLSVTARGGDVAGTSSKRGVELISKALERRGTILTPLADQAPASQYVDRLQQAAYGRVSNAMIIGNAFEAALREGLELEPAYWVNRAIKSSPWDEGPEMVARVRSLPGPLDEEHEVFAAANELKPALEVAERGDLTNEELLNLHEAVTLIIRWTFMAAARWLIQMHPAWTRLGESADENEREIFESLRLELRMFDSALIHRRNKGEVVPLVHGIGGACFEILGARQKWNDKLLND